MAYTSREKLIHDISKALSKSGKITPGSREMSRKIAGLFTSSSSGWQKSPTASESVDALIGQLTKRMGKNADGTSIGKIVNAVVKNRQALPSNLQGGLDAIIEEISGRAGGAPLEPVSLGFIGKGGPASPGGAGAIIDKLSGLDVSGTQVPAGTYSGPVSKGMELGRPVAGGSMAARARKFVESTVKNASKGGPAATGGPLAVANTVPKAAAGRLDAILKAVGLSKGQAAGGLGAAALAMLIQNIIGKVGDQQQMNSQERLQMAALDAAGRSIDPRMVVQKGMSPVYDQQMQMAQQMLMEQMRQGVTGNEELIG